MGKQLIIFNQKCTAKKRGLLRCPLDVTDGIRFNCRQVFGCFFFYGYGHKLPGMISVLWRHENIIDSVKNINALDIGPFRVNKNEITMRYHNGELIDCPKMKK